MNDNNKKLSDRISSVAASVPDVIEEDPRNIVRSILILLEEIAIEDEWEDAFDAWRDKVGESWCEVSGDHWWIVDHCLFWGHQYCEYCGQAKYPEIPGSCGDCGDLMKITEKEYRKRCQEVRQRRHVP